MEREITILVVGKGDSGKSAMVDLLRKQIKPWTNSVMVSYAFKSTAPVEVLKHSNVTIKEVNLTETILSMNDLHDAGYERRKEIASKYKRMRTYRDHSYEKAKRLVKLHEAEMDPARYHVYKANTPLSETFISDKLSKQIKRYFVDVTDCELVFRDLRKISIHRFSKMHNSGEKLINELLMVCKLNNINLMS